MNPDELPFHFLAIVVELFSTRELSLTTNRGQVSDGSGGPIVYVVALAEDMCRLPLRGACLLQVWRFHGSH